MNKDIKHLYIHVPFCNNICFYCDFTRIIYNKDKVNKWLNRLKEEIKEECKNQYETIYIGGGTPSSLKIDELNILLELIKPYTNNVIEYTFEANPDSLDEDKIILLKEYGINRISLGLQSTNDEILKNIGRKHTFNDVKNKIALLRKYNLNNISVDLIYGLPNQDLNILKKTLEDILDLDLPHISIYSLTIEDNSIFNKKGIKQIDDELEADMYELIINTLCPKYKQYEISNFAKDDYESKHNISYWEYENFIGLSLGASSKIDNIRYTNTNSFEEYFNSEDIKKDIIVLDKKDQIFEHIMMSLRMSKGIDIKIFNALYDIDLLDKYKDIIMNNKNFIIDNNHLICSKRSILNNILLDFL